MTSTPNPVQPSSSASNVKALVASKLLHTAWERRSAGPSRHPSMAQRTRSCSSSTPRILLTAYRLLSGDDRNKRLASTIISMTETVSVGPLEYCGNALAFLKAGKSASGKGRSVQ